jgi:hypothetical protein
VLDEPPGNELDVVPGAARHLVADLLRLIGKMRVTHSASELPQLVPHLVSVPVR